MIDFFFIALGVSFSVVLVTQLIILNSIDSLKAMMKDRTSSIANSIPGILPTTSENQFKRRIKFRASSKLLGHMILEGKKYSIEIDDISETGALLIHANSTELLLNEQYEININIDPNETVKTLVEIVRFLGEGKYGVSFKQLSIQDKHRIRSYVNRQAENDLKTEMS